MSGIYLLDASVLIALCDKAHTAHDLATAWFADMGGRFATCPVTQMALLRHTLRVNHRSSFHDAKRVLQLISDMPNHEFWPAGVDCLSLPDRGVLGHGHLTDAYLVALARKNKGRIATLDRRMADVFSPVAFLVE